MKDTSLSEKELEQKCADQAAHCRAHTLRKYKYSPDGLKEAIGLVLAQARGLGQV